MAGAPENIPDDRPMGWGMKLFIVLNLGWLPVTLIFCAIDKLN